jgi:hypothetical protein
LRKFISIDIFVAPLLFGPGLKRKTFVSLMRQKAKHLRAVRALVEGSAKKKEKKRC